MVTLCMIVRDEAEVIGRAVASALPIVDRYCIVDTGSTDGTPELIEALLAELPGELHRREWVDFATNRNELLDLAPDDGELLMLDADMTIRAETAPDLGEYDAMMVPVLGDSDESGPIVYSLPLILAAGRGWEYRGVTHEYLALGGVSLGERCQAPPGLSVGHFADGGSREKKLERDRDLLAGALDRGEEPERSTFYLAQTESGLGRSTKAMRLYARRAEMGGWPEEVFVSLLRAGRLALALGEWAPAQDHLWRAVEAAPERRAEPLYELAAAARARDLDWLAYSAALAGREALRRPADALFVSGWVYDYGMLFEYSVCAQRVGRFEDAIQAGGELLASAALPPEYRDAVVANLGLLRGNHFDHVSAGPGATVD